MKKQEDNVVKQLHKYGFDGEMHREAIRSKLARGLSEFELTELTDTPDGFSLLSNIYIRKDPLEENYRLTGYSANANRNIVIPDARIGQVNALALHEKMDQINWGRRDLETQYAHFFSDDDGPLQLNDKVVKILADLWLLGENDNPLGAKVKEQLLYKFMAGTAFEKFYDLEGIKSRFEAECSFMEGKIPRLDSVYLKMAEQMNKPVQPAKGVKISVRQRIRKPISGGKDKGIGI